MQLGTKSQASTLMFLKNAAPHFSNVARSMGPGVARFHAVKAGAVRPIWTSELPAFSAAVQVANTLATSCWAGVQGVAGSAGSTVAASSGERVQRIAAIVFMGIDGWKC